MSVVNRKWLAQRPYILALVILFTLVLWMASGVMQAQEAPPIKDKTQVPVAKVKVETFYAQPMAKSVELYGRTEPDRIARLKAEVPGKIEKILVKRGAWVKKGQVIAEIAINDLEFQLARAKAELAQRELEFEGNARLNKGGYQGKVQLAQAESALVAVKAEIKRLELDIANTKVKAPFDGIMNTRAVEVGDYVKDGDEIAIVADLNPLVVRAHVTENQIGYLNVGQQADIRLLDNSMQQGTVRYIASVADDATNTFKIEVVLPNPDNQFKAGISGEVNITLEQYQAIKVTPALLALDEVGNVGIKSVVNNEVVFTNINIVKSESDGIWLTGLGDKADLITLGQGFVRAGDPVEAVTDAANAVASN